MAIFPEVTGLMLYPTHHTKEVQSMAGHKQIIPSGKRESVFFLPWRSAFILILFTAILDRAGLFNNSLNLKTFCSFTTLSSGYILLITLLDMLKVFSSNGRLDFWFSKFRALGVMVILITGLVYHLILLPHDAAEIPNYRVFTYGNIAAHYFAPAGMFFDWLLFDKKGRIGKWDPLIFVSLPVAYLILASIYAYYGPPIPGWETSFAYFFMDWNTLGVTEVIRWIAFLLVCILSLAYLIYLIDYLSAKKNRSVL